MKTIEQKAKAYDEALKRTEYALKTDLHESGVWAVKHIFPELAESEDERIRKWLIELVQNTDTNHNNMELSENCKLALAYLEKQKEPQNKSMAHEDSSWSGILTSPLCKDKNLDDIAQEYVEGVKEYNPTPDWNLVHTAVCYGYHLAEQKEQMQLPGIEDQGIPGKYFIPVDWVDACERYGKWEIVAKKPAEWSEEDENVYKTIMDDFNGITPMSKAYKLKAADFLKSLRPQPHWKPTEEQMEALNEIVDILAASPFLHQNDYLFNILKGLREELKNYFGHEIC